MKTQVWWKNRIKTVVIYCLLQNIIQNWLKKLRYEIKNGSTTWDFVKLEITVYRRKVHFILLFGYWLYFSFLLGYSKTQVLYEVKKYWGTKILKILKNEAVDLKSEHSLISENLTFMFQNKKNVETVYYTLYDVIASQEKRLRC